MQSPGRTWLKASTGSLAMSRAEYTTVLPIEDLVIPVSNSNTSVLLPRNKKSSRDTTRIPAIVQISLSNSSSAVLVGSHVFRRRCELRHHHCPWIPSNTIKPQPTGLYSSTPACVPRTICGPGSHQFVTRSMCLNCYSFTDHTQSTILSK